MHGSGDATGAAARARQGSVAAPSRTKAMTTSGGRNRVVHAFESCLKIQHNDPIAKPTILRSRWCIKLLKPTLRPCHRLNRFSYKNSQTSLRRCIWSRFVSTSISKLSNELSSESHFRPHVFHRHLRSLYYKHYQSAGYAFYSIFFQ